MLRKKKIRCTTTFRFSEHSEPEFERDVQPPVTVMRNLPGGTGGTCT